MRNSWKVWKCECGNQDQKKVITASDGEVVCGKCGTVLGQVKVDLEETKDKTESWNGEADFYRKTLEDHVSKKGWEF